MRLFLLLLTLFCFSCSDDGQAVAETPSNAGDMKINITINGKTMPVVLVDNSATKRLVELLKEGPITYEAEDYGGFEKVGPLGYSLPTSNTQITTEAGDVILYSGNQIVLFYGSNSWSYTRLGRIQYGSLQELKDFLQAGKGNVTVKLSAESTTGVLSMVSERQDTDDYISLSGLPTKNSRKGIYIKNGKKYLK